MSYKLQLQSAGWPMDILIIDFETYFDTEYTLSKMSTIEYITDKRFQFTGLGYGNEHHASFTPSVESRIKALQHNYGKNLEKVVVVVANAKFDVTVLVEKFGIEPPYVVDVQDLARHYDSRMSHSVKDLAEMYGLPSKGNTMDFKGLTWDDMTPFQRIEFEAYTLRDIEIEGKLFVELMKILTWPEVELQVARHTLGLYLRPRFVFDYTLAKDVYTKMEALLDGITIPTGRSRKLLGSKNGFVDALQSLLPEGETVPMKFGKNEKIPALAKGDEEFQALLLHPDRKVRDLCNARLAVKSWPLHIKRVQKMQAQSTASMGRMRVPLHYYGCHTGRPSGGEKINLLNLGGKGRAGLGTHKLIALVRTLLKAPAGKKLVIVDSAQIEARFLAWIAGQDDLVKGFANNEDIYSVFASDLFQCEVRKPTDEERANPDLKAWVKDMDLKRGFGKDAILGCVAEGTAVLTKRGWVRIEDVDRRDMLWDGTRYVLHDGVINRGKKKCVSVNDQWLTPEHEVLTSEGWTTAVELSMNNLKSARSTGLLQLLQLRGDQAEELSPSNAVAPVVECLLRQETIWSPERLHAVMCVLKKHPGKLRAIRRGLKSHISHAFLTEFVQSLADVRPNHIDVMVNEGSGSFQDGSQIELIFLNTWLHFRAGTTPFLRLTGSTTTKDIDLVISDSLLGQNKLETRNVTCYDILNVGPYKRFQAGPMMVANCGYGMGDHKFYDRCRSNPTLRPLFDSGEYTLGFITKLIKTYRKKYSRIPAFWRTVEDLFKHVIKNPDEIMSYYLTDPHRNLHRLPLKVPTRIRNSLLTFWNDEGTVNVQLPSGRVLYYRNAKIDSDNEIRWQSGPRYPGLWGGSITENIVQSICRDLLILWIIECEKEGIPVVLHCYDEIVGLAKNDEAEEKLTVMERIMQTVPEWAPGLPMGTEGMISEYYKK